MTITILTYMFFCSFFSAMKMIWNIWEKKQTIVYRLIPSGLIGWFDGYERRDSLFKVFLLVINTGWNAERVEERGRVLNKNLFYSILIMVKKKIN
jgi:hypothetical protein